MNNTITTIKSTTPYAPVANYTGYGWQGKLYDPKLSIVEISQFVKGILKKQYPTCTFSIRTQRYSGGQSLSVQLMKSDFTPFATPDLSKLEKYNNGCLTDAEKLEYWNRAIEKGSHGINQYYIKDDYMLNEKGMELFQFVNKLICAYNYDDSDGQIDYFNTNFYYDIGIGRWNKAFTLITK